VGTYDQMLKDELRELCLKRGLPVSGTNAELIARLEGADAAQTQQDGQEPDLLAEVQMTDGDEPEQAQTPTPVTHPTPDPVREPEPTEDPVHRTVHRARFECPRGVIPTDMHTQFLRATENAAIAAGNTIRGGAARTGFQEDDGKYYAVYEVALGRRRQQVR
jgi:hypothetical protein